MEMRNLARDLKILRLRDRGKSYQYLARRFGLGNRQRVQQICKRTAEWKRMSNNPELIVGLDGLAYNTLKRLFGVKNPTIHGLRSFIEGNSNWKKILLMADRCGPATVKKIEDFARENGIKVD